MLAGIAVLLLAGAGVAALVIAPMLTYDDVTEGSFSGVGDRGRSVDAGPFGDYFAKRYVGGGRTTAEASIANGGDRDVEVVGLGDAARRVDVTLEGVRVAPASTDGGSPRRYVAFEPFELAAGEERALEMRFRMGRCDALEPGDSVTVQVLPVRYRTGFAERAENIELRSPIEFRRTENCKPPRRPGSR